MLMEREGNWPGVLAAYNLALLAHSHPTGAGVAGGPYRGGPGTSAHPSIGPSSTHGAAQQQLHRSGVEAAAVSATGAAAAAAAVTHPDHLHYGVASALDKMGCSNAAVTYLKGVGGCAGVIISRFFYF
jgi:hypothetical protein